MNFPGRFFEGGVIVYLILLCLAVTVYFTIERLVILRKAQIDAGQFMIRVRSLFRNGNTDPVLAFCSQQSVPIANIIRRGALKHDLGIDRVRDAIDDAAEEEVYRLGRRLPILTSIIGLAPLLGLLGTVTEVANAIGRPTSSEELVSRISLGLGALTLGLMVGILALVSSAYIKAHVARVVHEMRSTETEFVDLLLQATKIDKPLLVQDDERPTSNNTRPAATLVFEDDLYFRRKKEPS